MHILFIDRSFRLLQICYKYCKKWDGSIEKRDTKLVCVFENEGKWARIFHMQFSYSTTFNQLCTQIVLVRLFQAANKVWMFCRFQRVKYIAKWESCFSTNHYDFFFSPILMRKKFVCCWCKNVKILFFLLS